MENKWLKNTSAFQESKLSPSGEGAEASFTTAGAVTTKCGASPTPPPLRLGRRQCPKALRHPWFPGTCLKPGNGEEPCLLWFIFANVPGVGSCRQGLPKTADVFAQNPNNPDL